MLNDRLIVRCREDRVRRGKTFHEQRVIYKLVSTVFDVGELESCPVDCCPSRNPGRCAVAHGSCPPECCGTSNCCVEEKSKTILMMSCLCVTGSLACICIVCIVYRYCVRRKQGRRVSVMYIQVEPGAEDSPPSFKFPPIEIDFSCGGYP